MTDAEDNIYVCPAYGYYLDTRYQNPVMLSGLALKGICTHYQTISLLEEGVIFGRNNSAIYFCETGFATENDFKSYIAAQHEAGTPIEVCYPVAEPWEEDITNTPEGQSLIAAKTIPLYTHIYCEDDVKPYMDISIRTVHGG